MISVLMGVHRLDEYVFPAIDSILAQEEVAFELVVVANGADADVVGNSIAAHYQGDERLRVLYSKVGQLAHALNIGLSNARYDYIARMDADDISPSNRLRLQLDFLKKNNLDLIGGMLELIDKEGNAFGVRNYPKGKSIDRKIYFKNCFAHNTILCKKQLLIDARGYSGGFNSEDYDLWLRLRRKDIAWDNMSEPLVQYRIHDAASQRNILGYAEVAGYMMREFVLSKNPVWLLSAILTVGKAIVRGK